MSTPRLTQHARERCVEMGISTKVAKRIVQNPSMTYPDHQGSSCLVHASELEPGYIAVTSPDGVVITVAFRTNHPYVRRGETFDLIEDPQ